MSAHGFIEKSRARIRGTEMNNLSELIGEADVQTFDFASKHLSLFHLVRRYPDLPGIWLPDASRVIGTTINERMKQKRD